MKFSMVILATLTAMVMAAPAPHPESDLDLLNELVKRQSFGCSNSCNSHKKLCWSCNSGGCSYTYLCTMLTRLLATPTKKFEGHSGF
ncbi:hypothetical protein TWF481_010768 [Arthrobotrys musiformis]|uniref:Uncharacterized protein n=1 Tax=Arthrobotrys musiformis TaxID=47236 RepID=A0AAV9W4H6_9PEZI